MTNELATTTGDELGMVEALAKKHGLDPLEFQDTVAQLCGCKGATKEHFLGLMMVSREFGLNPMLRQLYLMPTKKGVQVVVPIDGYLQLMHQNPEYVAHSIAYGNDDEGGLYCEVTIATRKQMTAGLPASAHREYLTECALSTGPWTSHPRRMLKHKAMSQAVRYVFGTYIPDENEWERAAAVSGGTVHVDAAVVDFEPAIPMKGLVAAGEIQADDAQAETPVGGAQSEVAPATTLFDADESRRRDAEDAL